MAEYLKTELFDCKGRKLWAGNFHDRREALEVIEAPDKVVALGYVLGYNNRINNTLKFSSKVIFKKAIEWDFLSIDNTLPGFVTVLPKAKLIERLIEIVNANHFKQLNAVEISFPSFFDYSSNEIKDLTKSYEKENRMFKLSQNDDYACRASYAADPGLFLWLKNKNFKDKALPYIIYSQTQVFRRYKSGEINGFPQLREFPLPDLHIICKRSDGARLYLKNLTIAAQNMRFLLEEEWAFSIDITLELYNKLEGFIKDVCQAIDKICIVNILKYKPRYYDMKSVFMMDAGDCAIMNFNMQWDQENPKLFNISNERKDDLLILHGTLMHSWYKILPVFINKILISNTYEPFPYHIAPIQLSIIVLRSEYSNLAIKLRNELVTKSIRCIIIDDQQNLSKAIKKSNDNYIPYFIIVGPKEAQNKKFQVTEAKNKLVTDLEYFLEQKVLIQGNYPIPFFSQFSINPIF